MSLFQLHVLHRWVHAAKHFKLHISFVSCFLRLAFCFLGVHLGSHLSFSDWLFNGAFASTNATIRIEHFTSLVDRHILRWFLTELHEKSPLPCTHKFRFVTPSIYFAFLIEMPCFSTEALALLLVGLREYHAAPSLEVITLSTWTCLFFIHIHSFILPCDIKIVCIFVIAVNLVLNSQTRVFIPVCRHNNT
jgi:hypothetical protein